MRWLLGVVLLLLGLGTLRTMGCGDESPCGDCNDGDPCTEDRCTFDTGDFSCDPPEPEDYYCSHNPRPTGTPCGPGKVCVNGVCSENLCAGCEDDGNSCTIDCVYETGACDYVPLSGDSCKGETHYGRCYDGVCIVCEELDCDDGDLCTTDHCSEWSGCYNEPVTCHDGDQCTVDVCDPDTGECSNTLEEGHGCTANRELGIGGTYLLGSCDVSGRCTGQPCDVTSEEEYLCPIEDPFDILEPWICCPWEHLPHYPRGYCTTHDNCLTALCQVECPSHWLECVYQEGVCPSP